MFKASSSLSFKTIFPKDKKLFPLLSKPPPKKVYSYTKEFKIVCNLSKLIFLSSIYFSI